MIGNDPHRNRIRESHEPIKYIFQSLLRFISFELNWCIPFWIRRIELRRRISKVVLISLWEVDLSLSSLPWLAMRASPSSLGNPVL